MDGKYKAGHLVFEKPSEAISDLTLLAQERASCDPVTHQILEGPKSQTSTLNYVVLRTSLIRSHSGTLIVRQQQPKYWTEPLRLLRLPRYPRLLDFAMSMPYYLILRTNIYADLNQPQPYNRFG